jgi:hypothetical protein
VDVAVVVAPVVAEVVAPEVAEVLAPVVVAEVVAPAAAEVLLAFDSSPKHPDRSTRTQPIGANIKPRIAAVGFIICASALSNVLGD